MNFSPVGTGRVSLRPPEAADAGALAPLVDSAGGWIALARRDLLVGDRFAFVMCPRAGGPPFGLVELTLDDDRRGGAVTCRAACSCGEDGATAEAARWVAGFGAGALGLERIRGAPRPGDEEDRTVFVAAAALADDRGRVLLTRRPAGKPMAGLWEFPGGKVEPGEHPRATLARELREELGLEIPATAFEPWDIVCHAYADFRLLMPLMRCRRWSGTPRPCEEQAVAWVEAARLAALAMPAADRPLINRLVAALSG